MVITGKTEDGRLVLGGAFYMWETHGLPLEITLQAAQEAGYTVDLYDYVLDAISKGMRARGAAESVLAAVQDNGGDAEAVRERLVTMGIDFS
jgi:alanyl-tRNA synthetase